MAHVCRGNPPPPPSQWKRLSATDASNIEIDARDQVNQVLLVGLLGVGGFIGPTGVFDMDALRASIAARISSSADPILARFTRAWCVPGERWCGSRSSPT